MFFKLICFLPLIVMITGAEIYPDLSTSDFNELDRYCKDNNIIITGVPEQGPENLYTLVSAISKLNLKTSQINETEIEAAYRLPKGPNNNSGKPIIVKLTDSWTKLQLIIANKLRKAEAKANGEEPFAVEINHYETAGCTPEMLSQNKRFRYINSIKFD